MQKRVFTLGHNKWHQMFLSDQVIVLGFRLRLTLPVLLGKPYYAGRRHDSAPTATI